MAKKSSSRRAPPSRPARPPAAKLWIGLRASLAALAIAAAATVWKQQFGSPPAAAPLGSTLSSRMAAPSPVELEVSHACEVARQLWGGEMSCSEFLAQHWEAWPKLSRPGTNWTRSLFSPSDVEWMIRQWPVRFHKNHGTAVLQKPGSGFLAHERTKRGDPVPEDILHVAMREGLTFVCHNLEVMHPSIASLVRHVAAFFHAYTQVSVNSPPTKGSAEVSPTCICGLLGKRRLTHLVTCPTRMPPFLLVPFWSFERRSTSTFLPLGLTLPLPLIKTRIPSSLCK